MKGSDVYEQLKARQTEAIRNSLGEGEIENFNEKKMTQNKAIKIYLEYLENEQNLVNFKTEYNQNNIDNLLQKMKFFVNNFKKKILRHFCKKSNPTQSKSKAKLTKKRSNFCSKILLKKNQEIHQREIQGTQPRKAGE